MALLKNEIKKYEECVGITAVIQSKAPCFSFLAKQDPVKTKAMIRIMMISFDKFIGVKNPLTEEHIEFITNTILTNYKWLTLADLCYVLKEAKMGKYGNLYERLSPMQFFGWLDNYFELRCATAEQISIREAEKYK